MHKQSRGQLAHQSAKLWLKHLGFEVLVENLRFPKIYRAGEVDILAQKAGALWVLEVKASRAAVLGSEPILLLRPSQRQRLLRSLQLIRRSYPRRPLRFALLRVEFLGGKVEKIEFFENPC